MYSIPAQPRSQGSLLPTLGENPGKEVAYRPYISYVIVRYRLVLSATLADFYINLKSCRHSYQIFCCLIKKLKKNITLFLKKTSFNVYLEEFFRFIIYSITLKRRGVRVKGAVLSKCRILKNDISAIIHESPLLAMGWT